MLRVPFLLPILGLVLSACGEQPAADPSTPSTTTPPGPGPVRLTAASAARHGIDTAPATMRPLRRQLVAPARVTFASDGIAHVGTPLRGRVTSVLVNLGSEVPAGAPLLELDSQELGEAQLDLVQALGRLPLLMPRVEFSRDEWQRAKALFAESQGIAESEVRRREAEHTLAAAAVREAELTIAAARQRLALYGMAAAAIDELVHTGTLQPRTTLRAPLAGTVIAHDVALGALVGPDHEALLTIADTNRLWVLAQVPESRLDECAPGSDAEVRFGDGNRQSCRGTVAAIAPSVDPSTRTAAVRIHVRAPGLRAGMFAEARITATTTTDDVLVVPATAVQNLDGQSVVFVPIAGESNTFVPRPVEVGEPVDGFVPLRAGLSPGEAVVTTCSFVLKAQALQSLGDDGQ